jgi:hypothetical protein
MGHSATAARVLPAQDVQAALERLEAAVETNVQLTGPATLHGGLTQDPRAGFGRDLGKHQLDQFAARHKTLTVFTWQGSKQPIANSSRVRWSACVLSC